MRAAVLHEYGVPSHGEFAEPTPSNDRVVVEVAAAGVNPFDVLLSSGTFYVKPAALPCVVGLDGVGRLSDGRRVYFENTVAPFGSAAERTLVESSSLVDLPEGVDDEVAAALGNAGLAAWLSLEWGAELSAGDTVLILGATGTVGSLAVQIAKLLGAERVIAAGRSTKRLGRAMEHGADACIGLTDPDFASRLAELAGDGVDVVLDLVWGSPVASALSSTASGARVVQVGNLAGVEASLNAAVLRSKALTIKGYANYNVPREERHAAYRKLAEHAAAGRIQVEVARVPLEDVSIAWERQSAGVAHKQILVPAFSR